MAYEDFTNYNIGEIRSMLSELGGTPGIKKKDEMITEIIKIRSGELVPPARSNRGRPSTRSKRKYTDHQDKSLSTKVAGADNLYMEGLIDFVGNHVYLRGINSAPSQYDIYVLPNLASRYNLVEGDKILAKADKTSKKGYMVQSIEKINDINADEFNPMELESLPIVPLDALLPLKEKSKYVDIINLACPILMGQRGILTAEKSTGKTTWIKEMVSAIDTEKVVPIVATIDEKPEDIAYLSDSMKGKNCEYTYSTFDQGADAHIKIAEMAFMRAISYARMGKSSIVILDSLNKLVSAYRHEIEGLSLDKAIFNVKRLLSAAKNFGTHSITIVVIGEVSQFETDITTVESIKKICNMQLSFDSKLAKDGVLPPIDFENTNTSFRANNLGEYDLPLHNLVKKIALANPNSWAKIITYLDENIYSDNLYNNLVAFSKELENENNNI